MRTFCAVNVCVSELDLVFFFFKSLCCQCFCEVNLWADFYMEWKPLPLSMPMCRLHIISNAVHVRQNPNNFREICIYLDVLFRRQQQQQLQCCSFLNRLCFYFTHLFWSLCFPPKSFYNVFLFWAIYFIMKVKYALATTPRLKLIGCLNSVVVVVVRFDVWVRWREQ